MNRRKLFSRGIASGEGFCNRTQELSQLISNIESTTHTLLVSPRRYGKTSLILRSIEKASLPFAHIDFFMKYDGDSMLNEIYEELARLLARISKPSEKAIKKFSGLLKYISIGLSYKEFGVQFKVEPTSETNRKNLKQLFLGIDEFLQKQKQHIVIFIDEMQSIVESDMCDEIESALRFVAQKTENITFFFSGSSRRLMGKIFEERSRPFYKLCQKMQIQRIAAQHYEKFINKAAIKQWGSSLSQNALHEIFRLTERHPYYMNVLCHYLFEEGTLPTEENVTHSWNSICIEEQGSVAKDIEFLTPKQKLVLSEIARTPALKEPTGAAFLSKLKLSPRGALTILDALKRHDLVEQLDSGEYHVIDPVIAHWSVRNL